MNQARPKQEVKCRTGAPAQVLCSREAVCSRPPMHGTDSEVRNSDFFQTHITRLTLGKCFCTAQRYFMLPQPRALELRGTLS